MDTNGICNGVNDFASRMDAMEARCRFDPEDLDAKIAALWEALDDIKNG